MIDRGAARESEIVLAFLKAETDRWNGGQEAIQNLLQRVGITGQQLIEADLQNDYYNALRAIVLDAYRGYLRRDGLFRGFPKDVTWRRVELEAQDLQRLRYVKSVEWFPHSDNTR